MSRLFTISVMLAMGLGAVPPTVTGDEYAKSVYDFGRDFSADENPHGAWTVGSFNHFFSGRLNDLKNLTTYGELKFTPTKTACGNGGLRGWGNFSAGFFGLGSSASGVVKNTGSSASYSIPAGSVGVFPQDGPIVVRWSAPKAGKVEIRARFVNLTYLSDSGGFPELWILHNQDRENPLFFEKAHIGSGELKTRRTKDQKTIAKMDKVAPVPWPSGPRAIFRGSASVAAGDQFDFVVDPMYTACPDHSKHPEGNATDIVELMATISYMAESVATK